MLPNPAKNLQQLRDVLQVAWYSTPRDSSNRYVEFLKKLHVLKRDCFKFKTTVKVETTVVYIVLNGYVNILI